MKAWMLVALALGFVSGWAYGSRPASAAALVDAGHAAVVLPGEKLLKFQQAGEELGHVTKDGEIWVNPKLSENGRECVRHQLHAWLPQCEPWRAWCRGRGGEE